MRMAWVDLCDVGSARWLVSWRDGVALIWEQILQSPCKLWLLVL